MYLKNSTNIGQQHKHGPGAFIKASFEGAVEPAIRGKREAMDADLLQDEVDFRRLFESSPNAMFATDEAGMIKAVNEKASLMFGYRREELISRSLKLLIPNIKRAWHPAVLQNDNDKAPIRAIFQGIALAGQRRDGSMLTVEVSLSPVRIGDTVRMINTVRDLSTQRHNKCKLRQRDSDAEVLTNTQSDLIVRIDSGMRFLYVNATAEKVFGLLRAALIGRAWTELAALSGLTDVWLPPIRQTLVDGLARRLKFVFKMQKGVRNFEVHIIPEYGVDDKVAAALLFGHDVTDIRNTAEIIQRTQTQMRSSKKRIQNFGFFEWNHLTGQRAWSDEIFHIFGLEPGNSENTFESVMKMVHPQDRKRVRSILAKMQTKCQAYQLEYRIVRLTGIELVIVECGYATSSDDGKFSTYRGYIFTKEGGVIPELKQPLERLLATAAQEYSLHSLPSINPIVSDEERRFLSQLQQLTIPGDII